MKLIAQWPIKLDGKDIDTGEEFDCQDEKCAAQLMASGSAQTPGSKKESGSKEAASGSGGGELSQEERNAKIRQVLTEMLEEDPKQENNLLWTKAGDPRNKVVDSRTGLDVTNDELGPIWAELKPKD